MQLPVVVVWLYVCVCVCVCSCVCVCVVCTVRKNPQIKHQKERGIGETKLRTLRVLSFFPMGPHQFV